MKKLGYILLLIFFAANIAHAQDNDRFERIHAIKVAYITDKIHLSSEQAAQFWPVYNRYEKEMFGIRKQYMQQFHDKKMAGDNDYKSSKEFIDARLKVQEAQLNLEKKYKDEFLKVISTQQLADLYQAERDFKQMLLQQLKNRRQERR